MNNDFVEDIATIVDYLDKVVKCLSSKYMITREDEIAIQKLEEAVFWLTYGIDEGE